MERPDTASLMASIVTELQQERSERSTVEAIVAKALDVVPEAQFVSLTVQGRRHKFQTLVASSDVAEEADRAQYALDEGPCLMAARDSEWIRSGTVGEDHRWPRWGPVAASLGIGSLLSVPMQAEGLPVGALNLYSETSGQFAGKNEVDVALVFAIHAAQVFRSVRLVHGLEAALSSRHHIGAAQGVLMERYGLDLAQSFGLLQRLSSHTNTKLSTIARQIVETGRVPTLEREQEQKEQQQR